MAEWRKLASKADLKDGSPLSVEVDGTPIGLFRVGDEIFALHDVCPHEYALLSTGFQDGETIECPLHQALFNVRTGEHLTPPAPCGVKSFAVRIKGDDIFVALSEKNGGNHQDKPS